MFNKIVDLFKKSANPGLHLPLQFDPTKEQPSVTLFFAYVTFLIAVISVILLHFDVGSVTTTSISIIFWVLALVLYRIRHLDKAKFDLDDKSFELSGDSDEEPTPTQKEKK